MALIHGFYHFRARRTAFRNDFCRRCDAPRLAVQVRTLDVLHLFWVPLLPVGFWRRWRCAQCDQPPHRRRRTRLGFKLVALPIGLLFALAGWGQPFPPDARDAMWFLRIVSALILLSAVVSIVRHRREPPIDVLLSFVEPFEGKTCPLCGGPLARNPRPHCGSCQAEVRVVRRRRR